MDSKTLYLIAGWAIGVIPSLFSTPVAEIKNAQDKLETQMREDWDPFTIEKLRDELKSALSSRTLYAIISFNVIIVILLVVSVIVGTIKILSSFHLTIDETFILSIAIIIHIFLIYLRGVKPFSEGRKRFISCDLN